MTTATAIRTDSTIRPVGPGSASVDPAARQLRRLHAHAGQLVAGAGWTPAVEHLVHALSTETRRTIAEVSGVETFAPSAPGSPVNAIVRLRELGVLQRKLTEVLRRPVDPEPIRRAVARTAAIVADLPGTLA